MLSNCQRQTKIFKVISKTQTPGIPQYTWNIPVKQTHVSGFVAVSLVYPFLHLIMFPLTSRKCALWISEESASALR